MESEWRFFVEILKMLEVNFCVTLTRGLLSYLLIISGNTV